MTRPTYTAYGPGDSPYRIARAPRPRSHPGYRAVDQTLAVPPVRSDLTVEEAVREHRAAEAFEVVAAGYVNLRAEVLAGTGAFDAGWTDDHDLLHCPDGHPVEDDGTCPDGHRSPLLDAGLI